MTIDIDKINLLRADMGYSVPALARAAGLSPAAVNRWMKHGQTPRLEKLGALAAVLGVKTADIVKAE